MLHAFTVATLLAGQVAATSNICSTQACVVYAETPTDLYTVDPVSLTQTHVCTFSGVDGDVNDIAVDNSGNLYGLTDDALYTVDPTSCVSTFLTSVASISAAFNGLTFLPDGRLVGADGYGNVVQIDPSSGNVSQVGSFGGGYGCSGDIVALSTGEIYATAVNTNGSGSSDILVTLNSSSFAATRVGAITGFQGIYGLGFWAGTLYGFDAAGNVLNINPSTGHAQVLINNASLVWFGAGTTPQAPVVCTNPCTSGTVQCDSSGNLETCTTQSNGCSGWSVASCGAGLVCSGGQCVATCTNQCSAGTTQCDSLGNLDTCALGGNGCDDWSASACGSGLTCSGGQCIATCVDRCTAGSAQCDASGNVQTCSLGSNGCYDWLTSSCGSGLICSSGQCVAACANRCSLSVTQCANASTPQTCAVQSDGCTDWVDGTCASGLVCSNGSCVPNCTNRCLPPATQCDSTTGDLDTCELQADGCYDWAGAACPTGQACTNGACASTCTNACSTGQVECQGNTPQSCALEASGCYEWSPGTACVSPQICTNGQCALTCTDACTSGASQCASVLTQTCQEQANGCTEWVNQNDCGRLGCFNGQCCDCAPGATQCTASGELQTCTAGAANTCPTWTTSACSNHGSCLDGACLQACNPQSEITSCPSGELCLNVGTGTFCVEVDADGGILPGSTSSGPTGGASGSVGSTGGTAGAAGSGASGTTAMHVGTSASGSIGGSTTAGAIGAGGIGGTIGGVSSTGKSSGTGSAGSTGHTTSGGAVVASGCGCSSNAGPWNLGWMLMASLGLRSRRRTSR